MAGDQKMSLSANQHVTIKLTAAYCLCETYKIKLHVRRMQWGKEHNESVSLKIRGDGEIKDGCEDEGAQFENVLCKTE